MRTGELDTIKAKYQIVGRDEHLNQAIDTALQVASTDLSVLVQGESGVGKEIIPRIIHDFSPRKNKRYIAINCGSIPEGTIDSELFGHEKGSFTGAVGEHDGYFAAADGGTLFLDEVGELPLSTQARLLRVLETGEYIRVGSNEPRKTNVRIVAATNVQLERAIREGKFREDLYFRLCTIRIKLPALRERGDDVIRLFKKFALDTAAKYNIPTPLRLSDDAEQVMKAYKWPGNIRQLRNVAEQMSILCREDRVVTAQVLAQYDIVPNDRSTDLTLLGQTNEAQPYDYASERAVIFAMLNQLANDVKALKEALPSGAGVLREDRFSRGHMLEAPHSAVHPSLPLMTDASEHLGNRDACPLTTDYGTSPSHVADTRYPALDMDSSRDSLMGLGHLPTEPALHGEGAYLDAEVEAELVDDDMDLNLEKMERYYIEEALRRHRNRRKMAAQDLGISERTLYRKIKEYGIDE